MRRVHSTSRLRSTGLQRVPGHCVWQIVALCFLVFTAYDLARTGTCAEEVLGLPSGIFAMAACTDDHEAGSDSVQSTAVEEHSRDSHEDEGGCAPEDCFCCCAHIRVSTAFVLDTVEVVNVKFAGPRFSLPSGPLESPFHPPRSI